MNASGWQTQTDGQQMYWDGQRWTEHFAPGVPPPVQTGSGTSAIPECTRKARLARAVQQEDHDDQEDGLLTVVTFVVLGLCIIMALAISRA